MKKWTVIIILAVAQFIMVLDSTVMNVSISQVVADLQTTVSGLQAAITLYTLVMASFMLTGGKLGDLWGRQKTFKYGLVIYGLGSLITALSPNLPTLLIGWSVIEGLGAILVIPAIAALIASNYTGKDRVISYSIIGAITGAAAAAGPIIGGAVTTYLSWRYVFAAETVVVTTIFLFFANRIKDIQQKEKTHIDIASVALSVSGLFIIGLAILQTKVWGWVQPIAAPVIAGHEITPFGLSVVPFLLIIGFALLWWFGRRQRQLEAKGRPPLLHVGLLKIPQLNSGLTNIAIQYLLTAGLFFVIPVYLQMVLGFNALSTGLKIVPLSIALILFSMIGARWTARYSPKRIIFWGKLALIFGMLILLWSINPELSRWVFALGMFAVGAGLGLMASQVGNVIISSTDESKSSEAGGLQGTFQNIGSSLGTALIGSVLIASLTTGFVTQATNASSPLPNEVKSYFTENPQLRAPVVSKNDIYNIATSKGLSENEANAAADYYLSAQMRSLKISLFALGILALISLFFSHGLPEKYAT